MYFENINFVRKIAVSIFACEIQSSIGIHAIGNFARVKDSSTEILQQVHALTNRKLLDVNVTSFFTIDNKEITFFAHEFSFMWPQYKIKIIL